MKLRTADATNVMPGSVPRIFHIEDDPLWVDVIAGVIRTLPNTAYAGSASTGNDGLSACKKIKPAVVLLDLRLPDIDGLRLIDALHALPDAPYILLLSCRKDEVTLLQAWSSKVGGLIWKSPECSNQLRAALQAFTLKRRYYPPEVLASIHHVRRDPNAFFKVLSDRELSLIPFLAKGEPDAAIAAELGLSVATAHSHRQNIMRKLNLHRSIDLMRWAMEKGFHN